MDVKKTKGFTLIEIVVVMGLFAVLSAIATINLLRPQTKFTLDSTVNVLYSDLKKQQLNAMVANTNTGIYFESDKYTVFEGDTYSPSNTTNFEIELESGVSFPTINLPSSQIIFNKRGGEVSEYSDLNNNITIEHVNGLSQIMSINRYGTTNTN